MSMKNLRYREKIESRQKAFRRGVLLAILAILLVAKEPGANGEVDFSQQKENERKSDEKDLANNVAKELMQTTKVGVKTPDPKNITELLEFLGFHDGIGQNKDFAPSGFPKNGNMTEKFIGGIKRKTTFLSWFVTVLVGLTLVSTFVAHRFYEKYKLLKPLERKLFKKNGDLWKTTMAYNSLEDDFDALKESHKNAFDHVNAKIREVEAELELAKENERVQCSQLDEMKTELKSSTETRENERKCFEKMLGDSKEETIQLNKRTAKLKADFEKELENLKITNDDLDNSVKKQHREMEKVARLLKYELFGTEKELREKRNEVKFLKVEAQENREEKVNTEKEISHLKEVLEQYKTKETKLLEQIEREKSRHALAEVIIKEEIEREDEIEVQPKEDENRPKRKTFGQRVRKRISSLFRRKSKNAKVAVMIDDPGKDGEHLNCPGPGGDILITDLRPKSNKFFWKRKVVVGGVKGGEG